MSALPTDPIRREHRHLQPHLEELEAAATEVGQWDKAAASERLPHIVDFFETHLIPHARAEEEILYPAVDEAMRVPNATATMRVEHDEIAVRVGRLRESVNAALDDWSVEQAAMIAHQLSGLSSIILLHFRKEEEVLLPILDKTLTVEEAEALFESMHVEREHLQ